MFGLHVTGRKQVVMQSCHPLYYLCIVQSCIANSVRCFELKKKRLNRLKIKIYQRVWDANIETEEYSQCLFLVLTRSRRNPFTIERWFDEKPS